MFRRRECGVCFKKLPWLKRTSKIIYMYTENGKAKHGTMRLCSQCDQSIDENDIREQLETEIRLAREDEESV